MNLRIKLENAERILIQMHKDVPLYFNTGECKNFTAIMQPTMG